MEFGARSASPRTEFVVESRRMYLTECGLGKYSEDAVKKAVERWHDDVANGKRLSYGELGFHSKINHDGISNHRHESVYAGFIGIAIFDIGYSAGSMSVSYYIMPSCDELTLTRRKYHLVPRLRKHKDDFDIITIDVELD